MTGSTTRSNPAALTVRSVTTRAIRVPLTFALGTTADVVRTAPILLVDLTTEEGITGRAYLFCYTESGAVAIAAHLAEAVGIIKGKAAQPQAVTETLNRRYRLLGVTGPVRMAIAALDMALWDAAAFAAAQPLAVLLGAKRRPIAAYDSRGLGLMAPEKLKDEVQAMLAKNMRAVKLRLGYPTLAEDMRALQVIRANIPDSVQVMVDYNQALTTEEAITRGLALQQEGIVWLEEPIRHDDYRGNAEIAKRLDVPLQIGENFNGPEAMAEAIAMKAYDYMMPDVARIGGVTGWMQAASLAATHDIKLSSHQMPELSIQMLTASPTAHWIEYVDWADAFLEQPMPLVDSAASIPDRPGMGITWDETKLKRLETF